MAVGTGDNNSFWPMVCADGHRQLLCCCSAGARARQILRKGTPHLPGVWPPQPLPPSTDCGWVRAQAAGPGKGLGGAPAPCQPPPWMWMAWHERSCICSSLFVSVARRTAGLAVSFSVLALAARKARHTQQSGKQQNAGVWPERQGLVLEHYCATWLHRLVGMPQLGDNHVVCTHLCCLL